MRQLNIKLIENPESNFKIIIKDGIIYKHTLTLKGLLISNTNWWHLSCVFITILTVTTFLLIFFIPFVFWSAYGSGASSDRISDLPIVNFAYEWLALIISLFLLGLGLYLNTKKHNLPKAKSYLLATPVLILVYLFKYPILDFMFTMFQ